MFKVLDLFSGIGGFSLGLERTGGFETVAFCETDKFCQRVLAKHWPSVKCYSDVKDLTYERLKTDGIKPDVICGGFPCQDISIAGKGAGIDGERSGLWSDFARLIGEIRPRYAIVENVSALLNRGLDRVLGDLAEIGYDSEWHCIPAAAVGAPHRRDRIWIVADCKSKQSTECDPRVNREKRWKLRNSNCGNGGVWPTEPDVGRVAHGIPARVDRLKSLGNAVVPQVVQVIGEAILEAERRRGISPPPNG